MGANCTKEGGCTKDASYHWSITTENSILSDDGDLNFSALSDDVILLILSFVSYAMMELRTTQLTNKVANNKEAQKRAKREQGEIDRLVKDYNRQAQKINKSQEGASRRLLNPVPYRPIVRVKNTERSKFGSLTHVFPLVNHRTRGLCLSSDVLWKEALIRLCNVNEEASNLWIRGLRSFVDKIGVEANASASEINEHTVDQDEDANSLVLEACRLSEIVESTRDDSPVTETSTSRRDENNNDEDTSVARNVFRQILCDGHVLKRLPLFHMTSRIPSNTGESWHLHEPRYRILIDQIMSGRSDRDRQGRPIIRKPRPRFAYSFQSADNIQNNVACIVDITRCRMYSDGAADVVVLPMVLIKIEELEEQENGQGLLNAIYREIQND